ncbi:MULTISPECIES: PhzF family phenazine biosynthesis protein [Stenotrophomonas]|jgi:PhzF family phenazine biosynthesis protein|uniref:PhzF family phenazine biosynthesis protein n=1 Tax=Stenotrophomonas maltophilia TaxID=40324 RepID=A0AA40Y3V1_STEMA|nr:MULTISPECIES: PhzF family phenazine biosynthesis protein [Stenotrophomonas]AWB77481.1 PhzF family phenazine biosynthesis protein [Stenotrophomonas maltophilia]CCH11652.1 Phenazine biosynthesis protein PhzF like [Stenotrophomonas maltophilia D457]KOO75810.1 phenazine biosynthesis protein [Stenotrophomonas maltophilia]KOQ56743.1 phenazine biosynthesis protein [Stenotrophomonas maltophilia]MBH1361998.1 PhzF family phenazine biosynthesis protein [Stenotrophomonas maltophilia]
MALLRYLQLDVFASRPGTGNPLGALLDADALSGEQMQALAAWLNLSETVFFLRPSAPGADYHIRIFTPTRELAFAGHPSVGAAWAAVSCGLAQPRDGALLQQCAAGVLPVRVSGPAEALQIQLASPPARQLATGADAAPETLLALAANGHVPELWDNGARWWLLPLRDAAAVRGLAPDMAALRDWSLATEATGVAVFADEAGTDHTRVVRAFCPADAASVPEDPVTGSANALIAAWLRQRNALPGREGHYVASQGREVGRDGHVQVQVDAQGTVWIGGQVQPVIDGHLRW